VYLAEILLVVIDISKHRKMDWLSKLNLKRINMGKGPRAIYTMGKYNKKYQIHLPAMLYQERRDQDVIY